MAGLKQTVRKLIGRWFRQQETALWQMTERKTAAHRFAGFVKSERIDAKFFVLALVPFLPLAVSDEVGWSRGAIWYAWFWLSASWAAVIFGICFTSYWRAFRRSLDRDR